MKHIAFKAYVKADKKWIDVHNIGWNLKGQISHVTDHKTSTTYPIENVGLCQNLGILDSEGVEMKEDDILEFYYGEQGGNSEKMEGQIKYYNYGFYLVVRGRHFNLSDIRNGEIMWREVYPNAEPSEWFGVIKNIKIICNINENIFK